MILILLLFIAFAIYIPLGKIIISKISLAKKKLWLKGGLYGLFIFLAVVTVDLFEFILFKDSFGAWEGGLILKLFTFPLSFLLEGMFFEEILFGYARNYYLGLIFFSPIMYFLVGAYIGLIISTAARKKIIWIIIGLLFVPYLLFSFIFSGCIILPYYMFADSTYSINRNIKNIVYLIGEGLLAAVIMSILIVTAYYLLNRRKHLFARYHFYALALNIISLYMFTMLLDDVLDGETITRWDVWLSGKMTTLWKPLLNKLMIIITYIGSAPCLLILSGILVLILLYRKRYQLSIILGMSMGGGVITEFLIKYIMQRPRPTDNLIAISGYSFPSAHTTMSTIFFSILLYSFKDNIKSKTAKTAFIAANVILFILIGFSRIYLNVHWLSDVIAGICLGIFWLTISILVLKYATFELEKHKTTS